MTTLRRLLSVVYALAALFIAAWSLFGMQLISMGGGNSYEMLAIGTVLVLLFVSGAIEAWRARPQRSLLQKVFLYVPGVLLLLWILDTWFVPQEVKSYIHYFFE